MKNKKALLWLLIPLLLIFTNCIQVNTKVIVNKDGSGTIEYTYIISDNFVAFMNKMSKEKSDKPDVDLVDQMIAEGVPQKAAANFGEGVTFVSYEKISTDVGKGFKGIYSFADIGKVTLNQNPMNPDAKEGQSQDLKEYYHFQFQPGNPATLVIIQPKKELSKDQNSTPQKEAEISDDMLEMIINLYKDMKISMQVTVNGAITETNARYVDKAASTVTLLEIDFGKLTEDKEGFKALMKKNPKSIGEMEKMLGKTPGLKMELAEKLRVKFD
ncbi:MAG: hypothetical protein P8107_06695 [Spirochaetia bacterium]|jgi:hypothetical protein